MQVDISFDFAKVYNIEKADVVKGQKFSLITDAAPGSKWFADQDEVLSLKVTGSTGEVTAGELGTSTILIMDELFAIQKTIVIKVVESIQPMATSLGLSASDAEPK